jgi:hypothetical protein
MAAPSDSVPFSVDGKTAIITGAGSGKQRMIVDNDLHVNKT